MGVKRYQETDVLTAARERIAFAMDRCERAYIAFSGGKDSTVLFHLVMDEACWAFLECLLSAVARHPAIRFCSASSLFSSPDLTDGGAA